MASQTNSPVESQTPRYFVALVVLAILSAGIYWHLRGLSELFAYGSTKTLRPIPTMLSWFTALFVLHLGALWCGLRAPRRKAAVIVVLAACGFRAIMLFSEPIQEVDIYRYLWDGMATVERVSPFKYTPAEVIAVRGRQGLPEDLARLARRGDETDATREILRRVHFSSIPTVYPPVSQWGFALVEQLTPRDATLEGRLFRMRLWLVLCDVGVLLLVLAMLLRLDWHPAYAILYGWCPLVIKEVANSGHLDSMAVLITTLAIYFCMRLAARSDQDRTQPDQTQADRPRLDSALHFRMLDSVAAAVAMSLGIGAKIYPVVLLPWFAALTIRKLQAKAAIPLAITALLTVWIMWPMFNPSKQEAESYKRPPSEGISTFFKYWEMNDFLFLMTVENLRPDIENEPAVWFAVVPNRLRAQLSEWLESKTEMPAKQATFQLARTITAAVFGLIVCLVCHGAWRENTPVAWLRAAFLCLAWFWLVSPTQNPWYWTWALPLLPFARCRTWYLVGGLAMIYYSRFWFEYHFTGVAVMGTPYQGTVFFDFVVSIFEYGPWFAMLAAEALYRRREAIRPSHGSSLA